MKQTKLFLLLIISTVIFSCSSDDDGPDYTGTYKFNRGFVSSFLENNETLSTTSIDVTSEDCSIQEIVINANGTATITSSSLLGVSLEFAEGSTNELEHQLTCSSTAEVLKTYTWFPGPYSDGTNITIEVPGYDVITFVDENGIIQLNGTLYPGGILNIGSSGINSRKYTTELSGETLEIKEERFFNYKRQ
ncbi:hypothetical protein [Aquimarina mytili]|uniref:Lipocalin-like domain-containing protein n=1 Tax=Aquimarina mytili TaxID=874423 RepID=A0A937DAC8_9FLAO|nr:hypothetical protein [Aquimarina mytili]MBL0682556.1 hypothetical protein [Aquimarina mytili]